MTAWVLGHRIALIMSEYIEIETEETDDINVLYLETNITLAVDGMEQYDSAESLAEGSPLAQSISIIPGIDKLVIEETSMTITREPDFNWYSIIEDIRVALIDFFL